MWAIFWKSHGWRVVSGTTVLVFLGISSGQWVAITLVSLTSYLLWQLYNTWKLHQWLSHNESPPPESLGIWSDIFEQINRLQQQNQLQTEQLKETIEAFQSLNNAYPEACLVIDGQGCLSWFNDAACELLDLQNPTDQGQPLANLIRDPDFINWLAVQDRVNSPIELSSPMDPNIFLSARAVRFQQEQRLLILRDITDVHNLERVRRDFVANVSHELRTPLTVLHGYLETIEDQLSEQHSVEDLLPAIKRMQVQAEQMGNLLNDLIELSRVQTDEHNSEVENINVPLMLMQMKEQAAEISQGSHQLIFNVQSGLWISGIATDIESAFRNLIQNAVHYTPPGGKIKVSWRQEDSAAVFSVRDTGSGIPKRDIPRLTERFYRVGSDRSRHSGGTGLGLAIVKHVMNAHQAKLVIESELGEGSCFSCRFPENRIINTTEQIIADTA